MTLHLKSITYKKSVKKLPCGVHLSKKVISLLMPTTKIRHRCKYCRSRRIEDYMKKYNFNWYCIHCLSKI